MLREQFTNLVMDGKRISKQSLRRNVGLGCSKHDLVNLFIYFEFYVTFNTVQVISRRVVGRAEETSTYSSLGFCTVNGKQLPAFQLEAMTGIKPRPQRWEARVLPLCHHGPRFSQKIVDDLINFIFTYRLKGIESRRC